MDKAPLLKITIDNKQDIELFEFASSMYSLNDEYQRYINQTRRNKQKSDSRLMVNRVSEGSIVVDLCEKAIETLPAITPLILEYAIFLVKTLDYLSGKSQSLPPYRFLKEDFLNLKKLVEPVANVIGNTLTLQVLNFTKIENHIVINNTYNNTDAKAVQNQCDREMRRLEKAGDSLIKEKVNLKLYQARNSTLSKTSLGNLGVIEDISDDPKVLSFANERLRYDITTGEENPLNFTYSVDVEVKLKEGSLYLESPRDIKEYEILKLHGPIENTDLFDK